MLFAGDFIQYLDEEVVETEKYPIAPGKEINVPLSLGRPITVRSITIYYENGNTQVVTSPGAYPGAFYVSNFKRENPDHVIFRAF
jgi:hypothetical protein